MEALLYDAKYHLDPEAECFCKYDFSKTKTVADYTALVSHYHTYYEIYLVFHGELQHIVKSKKQFCDRGTLLFIRDFDRHTMANMSADYYEAINLAFSKETFCAMAEFLGDGFETEQLLTAEVSPLVRLSDEDTEKLTYDLMALNQFTDKRQLRYQARALLTRIFSTYFSNYTEPQQDIPDWLVTTFEKMKYPQNFIAGTKYMYELSGMSREHLTRCMQQYYHTTPTAYVSNLRLKHAASLLLGSKLKVTDICYECGFENLSWFYKSFGNEYGMTPREYRKKYQNEVLFNPPTVPAPCFPEVQP